MTPKNTDDATTKRVDFSKPETLVKPPGPKGRNDTLVGQLGLVIALCIVLSVFAGIYLDRMVGSKGILTFVMIIVGLVVAGFSAWTLLKKELPWNH